MSKGETRHELILLYDKLNIEPKKLQDFLLSRGQQYPYSTLKKYYGYFHVAKSITNSILTGGKK